MTADRPLARRRDRAGFVLVEALTTLALSALLIAALALVVGLMLRSADRGAQAVEAEERLGRSFLALSRDVDAAVRVRWAGEEAGFAFTGLSDRVMFVRRGGDGGDWRVVGYQSVPVNGGYELRRVETAFPAGTKALADLVLPAPDTLARTPGRWSFAYGREDESGAETSVDVWSEPGRLPSAIFVRLLAGEGSGSLTGRRLPLRAEAEPACALDDKDGYCSLRPPKADEGGEGETRRPRRPGLAAPEVRRLSPSGGAVKPPARPDGPAPEARP